MIFAAFEASVSDAKLTSPTFGGIPFEAEGEPLVNPATLSNDERRLLLEQIESREVMAIRAVVRMFIDKPNKNNMRPEPGRLSELVPLSAGSDVVRNHSSAVEDIGGSILASEVRDFEGADALVGLHRFSEPVEMAAFVRNERTRFSVAMGSERWECSACDAEGFSTPWGVFTRCKCDAEIFGRGELRFLHNSTVSRPAVEGTAILDLSEQARGALWASARARGLHPLNASPLAFGADGGKKNTSLTLGANPTNNRGENMPEGKTPEQKIEELEAKLATQEAASAAKAVELQATIDEQQRVHLDGILQAKTASFCITPAEHAAYHTLRESGQMELALSMLAGRQPMASTPTAPQGLDQTLTAQGGQPSEEATQWAACDAMVGQHSFHKDVLDRLKSGESIVSPSVFPRRRTA